MLRTKLLNSWLFRLQLVSNLVVWSSSLLAAPSPCVILWTASLNVRFFRRFCVLPPCRQPPHLALRSFDVPVSLHYLVDHLTRLHIFFRRFAVHHSAEEWGLPIRNQRNMFTASTLVGVSMREEPTE